MKDFIKNNYNRTLVKLIVLTTLVSSCGLDTCLYTTECKSTSVEGLACTNLGDTTIQRYTEEAMNDLESENYNHAIGLLDCLINNNNSDDKSYARRGLAYIGRTNRYAPTTLLLNLADPTYLTNLQTELTTIEPATSSEVDTLYQVGEDLIRGASDILTASSISDNPSTFQTLKWLSLLYNGIGSAYIFRSHRFFPLQIIWTVELSLKLKKTAPAKSTTISIRFIKPVCDILRTQIPLQLDWRLFQELFSWVWTIPNMPYKSR